MRLNKTIFSIFLFLGASFAGPTYAVCPICVVAVGAGVGLCRWLGIDDAISGLWIGGVLASLSIWTYFWLKKKNLAQLNAAKPQFRFAKLFNWVKNFKYSKFIVPAAYYMFVLAALYYIDIMGHPLNKFLGIDKILFGIIFGTIVFLLGYETDIFLRKKNQGKVFFYYQKVIIPLLFLIIMSVIFIFVIKCY